MNVDTVRRIDYYAGVPLCFAGTLLRKATRFFSAQTQAGPPRNILFIELSEMGSTILAEPAMRKAEQALKARIFFAIFGRNRPSLELLGTVPPENVFCIRDSDFFSLAADAVRFLFWTRRQGIDAVIDLELFSRFTALLTGFSGAARTVGFDAFHNEGLYRGDFLTHRVAYNPHQHIAKNFVALVNALLSSRPELPYSKTLIPDAEIRLRRISVAPEAADRMRRKIGAEFTAYDPGLHRVLLFNTNSSDLIPLRKWPPEYYTALARTVLERYPRAVILLTGDASERADKEVMVRAVNSERCINFAGRTTLEELPALYSISSLMLTNDSGPAHFASVTPLRVFVLFGPESPAIYGPLGNATPIYSGLACSPCVSAANHRKSVCRDNVCLQIISPAQVLDLLSPALESL